MRKSCLKNIWISKVVRGIKLSVESDRFDIRKFFDIEKRRNQETKMNKLYAREQKWTLKEVLYAEMYRCVVHTVYLLVFLNGGTLDLRYNHSFRFCFTFFLATESFCLKGQNGSLRENNCSLNVEASFWSVFCFLVLLSGEKAKNSQQTKLATNWNSRRDFSDCLEKVSFYIMLSNFVGI